MKVEWIDGSPSDIATIESEKTIVEARTVYHEQMYLNVRCLDPYLRCRY
jgi:hypothetical protein